MTKKSNPDESKPVKDILADLKVTAEAGLTNEEVKKRQQKNGLNEVPEEKQSMHLVFLRHFWGLTAFMLEFTTVTSFLLHKYIDVYLITGLMLFNATIGLVQERRASKIVQALKKSLQVFRACIARRKMGAGSGNQLVPGDIIRIRSGDFLTADAKPMEVYTYLESHTFSIEQKSTGIKKDVYSTDSGLATGYQFFLGSYFYLQPALHLYLRGNAGTDFNGVRYNIPNADFSYVLRVGVRIWGQYK